MQPVRFALSAFALTISAAPAFADDGLYARVSGGASLLGDFDQGISTHPDVGFIITPPSERSIDSDTGWTVGGALGFDYGDGFRTEAEYRYLRNPVGAITLSGGFDPSDPIVSPTVLTPDDQHIEAHAFLANLAYDLPLSGPLSLFVSAGAGGARVTTPDLAGSEESDWGFAYQGRVGAAYELSPGLAFGVDFAHLRALDIASGPTGFSESGPITNFTALSEQTYRASTFGAFLQKQF